LWLVVLLGLAPVAPAAAQVPPAQRAEARRVFDEAERQFNAENFRLALEGFTRSRALMRAEPRAAILILFNIGRAHEELGDDAEALAEFEQYLREAPADAPFRQPTEDRVLELRARLAARGAGSGGVDPVLIVGASILALGGLVALGSLPTGLLALDGASTLEARCPGGECPASEAGRIDEAHALGVATDVLWASGLAVAAAGAALLLVGLTGGDGERAGLRPGIACAGGGCLATLGGRL